MEAGGRRMGGDAKRSPPSSALPPAPKMRHRSASFEMPGGSGTFSREREKEERAGS